jgi:hypothetical protein
VYLGTGCSTAESGGTRRGIGCDLSDGTVKVASVEMKIRVYSKILVLGPIWKSARAGIQSAIHPKLPGRAREIYRAHGHRRATRNVSVVLLRLNLQGTFRGRSVQPSSLEALSMSCTSFLGFVGL